MVGRRHSQPERQCIWGQKSTMRAISCMGYRPQVQSREYALSETFRPAVNTSAGEIRRQIDYGLCEVNRRLRLRDARACEDICLGCDYRAIRFYFEVHEQNLDRNMKAYMKAYMNATLQDQKNFKPYFTGNWGLWSSTNSRTMCC